MYFKITLFTNNHAQTHAQSGAQKPFLVEVIMIDTGKRFLRKTCTYPCALVIR